MVAKLRDRDFENADSLERSLAQQVEYERYCTLVGEQSIVERYRGGALSVVLYLEVGRDVQTPEWSFPGVGKVADFVTLAVLQNHVVNGRTSSDWQEQFMLILDVHSVQSAKDIIPSRVGLYIGDDPFKDRGGGIYFSLKQRSVKVLSRIGKRKLCPLGWEQAEFLNAGDPSIVERNPEVVHSIPDNDRHLAQENLRSGQAILNRLASNLSVILNADSAGVFQGVKEKIEISDVLIGPFDL